MTAAPLTGRKVLAITVGFFAVIIGVNGVLAYHAIRTFPGLEVDNSYVASQTFDAERRAQQTLGWVLDVQASGDLLTLGFTGPDGRAVQPQTFTATIGRATEGGDDSSPVFAYKAGVYFASVDLAPGKWVLRLAATAADGTAFRQHIAIYVKG